MSEFDENTIMYLAVTLEGHKKMVELFNNMTSSQIKDALDIGIYNFGIMTPIFHYKTLYNTLNDLFGPMISAVTSAEYCIDKKYMKLFSAIILSHAYALFNPMKSYDHWPKTAIQEYLTYFEKLLFLN
jgi:hypothetical protein